MCKSVKKSNAPLFVCQGAHPEWQEPESTVMTKEETLEYLEYVPTYLPFDTDTIQDRYEQGEIICELSPLGFVYKDEKTGKIEDAEVPMPSLCDMLVLQSKIYDGELPKVEI